MITSKLLASPTIHKSKLTLTNTHCKLACVYTMISFWGGGGGGGSGLLPLGNDFKEQQA